MLYEERDKIILDLNQILRSFSIKWLEVNFLLNNLLVK
jgi:hypothetical protein